jgi:hypothetical protein
MGQEKQEHWDQRKKLIRQRDEILLAETPDSPLAQEISRDGHRLQKYNTKDRRTRWGEMIQTRKRLIRELLLGVLAKEQVNSEIEEPCGKRRKTPERTGRQIRAPSSACRGRAESADTAGKRKT